MFHVKHLTVRQARQVGSTQVRQAQQWSGTQAAQVRSGGQVSGETGETGSQAVSGSGAPHSGRCALMVWHVPMQKACHTVLISVK